MCEEFNREEPPVQFSFPTICQVAVERFGSVKPVVRMLGKRDSEKGQGSESCSSGVQDR